MKEALKPIFEQAIEDAVQSIKVRMTERFYPEYMRTELEVRLEDARTVFPTD